MSYARKGGPCNHPRCEGDPDGCRMYVDEVTAITPEAEAAAAELLAGGWISVSTKYRMMRRWAIKPPSPTDVLTQEAIDGPFGALLLEHVKRLFSNETALRMQPTGSPLIEECTVGPATHRAFRRLRDAPLKAAAETWWAERSARMNAKERER